MEIRLYQYGSIIFQFFPHVRFMHPWYCRNRPSHRNKWFPKWGYPQIIPFLDGIFPNNNHPAIGVPPWPMAHDYGNPQMETSSPYFCQGFAMKNQPGDRCSPGTPRSTAWRARSRKWPTCQRKRKSLSLSQRNWGTGDFWPSILRGWDWCPNEKNHPTIGDNISDRYFNLMWNKSPKRDICQPLIMINVGKQWWTIWERTVCKKPSGTFFGEKTINSCG